MGRMLCEIATAPANLWRPKKRTTRDWLSSPWSEEPEIRPITADFVAGRIDQAELETQIGRVLEGKPRTPPKPNPFFGRAEQRRYEPSGYYVRPRSPMYAEALRLRQKQLAKQQYLIATMKQPMVKEKEVARLVQELNEKLL